jgi:hypothetical protein
LFEGVNSIIPESTNIARLINAIRLLSDKILLRSLEKMGCKYLIGVANVYKGGVSQSNGGGYNP